MGNEPYEFYNQNIKKHIKNDFVDGMPIDDYNELKSIFLKNNFHILKHDSYRNIRFLYCYNRLIKNKKQPSNQYEKDFIMCFKKAKKEYYRLRIEKIDLMIFDLQNIRTDDFYIYQGLSDKTKEELNKYFEDRVEYNVYSPSKDLRELDIRNHNILFRVDKYE